jgi:hypothetical protein
LQVHHVVYEHLIDNIDWLYSCADTAEQLVISGGVFAIENGRRPEEAMPTDRLGR